MRKLLFTNYLEQYLRGVSGLDTLSIHKLSKASNSNYRLVDALVLYCFLTNNQHLLNKYTKNKYKDLFGMLEEKDYLDKVFYKYEFKKINDSYLSHVNATLYDSDTKIKARESIVKIMNEKKISKYRVYKDLNLNPGNTNAYLKNGDPSKVSVALVKKIYNYVFNY